MSARGRKLRLASGIAGALALVGCGGGGAKRDGGGIDLSGTAGADGAAEDGSAADGGDCAWIPGTASEVAGPPPAQNDSADLRGPAIGSLPFDAGTMRRVVPVAVGATIDGLQIGQAYLSRTDTFDETAYLTIPVTYSGTGHPCFVVASPLRYKNGDQILNDSSDESYVIGSVGDAGFGFYTDSCLNAGDSGYFIDIQLATTPDSKFFSGTTSLEMSVGSSFEGTTPAGRLVPTGYDLGSCGGMRTLRVSAVNDGTGPIFAPLYGFPDSPAIFLDAAALPAGWTYLGATEAGNVPPGATSTHTASVDYTVAVSRARFFLQFGPPLTAAAASLAALPDGISIAAERARASRQDLFARWRAATGAAAAARYSRPPGRQLY